MSFRFGQKPDAAPLHAFNTLQDEPTSGLDSYTADNLMHSLKGVAAAGRVVLASLHQPSRCVRLRGGGGGIARGGRTSCPSLPCRLVLLPQMLFCFIYFVNAGMCSSAWTQWCLWATAACSTWGPLLRVRP